MSTLAKTFAFAYVESLVVHVYAHGSLDDRDWNLWLEVAMKRPPDASLVFTPGGGPNARQRSKLMETVRRGYPEHVALPLVAIVTPNRLARGIVTALGWLGYQQLKSFEPGQWQDALIYLGVPQLADGVRRASLMLANELGVRDPLAR